jgi:hypothetical protein
MLQWGLHGGFEALLFNFIHDSLESSNLVTGQIYDLLIKHTKEKNNKSLHI